MACAKGSTNASCDIPGANSKYENNCHRRCVKPRIHPRHKLRILALAKLCGLRAQINPA